MAAPAFAAAGTILGAASGQTSAAVPVPAGVAVDDIVLVHMYRESSSTVTPPSGFTQVTPAPATTGNVVVQQLWWKRATAADSGTYTFTWSGGTSRSAVATRYTGCVTSGSPIDVVDQAARSSSGATTPAVSVTTNGIERLLVFSGAGFSRGSWTPPSSYTERVDNSATTELTVATREQAAAGSSGSVTATCSASDFQTARLIALIPAVTLTTVSSTETGAGTDVSAVQRASTVADTAAGTDAAAVLRSSTLADTAAGTDAAAVVVLTLKSTTDTGTGTDSALVEVPTPIARTDTGAGVDAASVAATVAVLETGTGADATAALLRSTLRAETGAATDTALVAVGVALTDSGSSLDAVSVVVLPDAAVAGLAAQRTVSYEVHVVRRVPQQSGPPTFFLADPLIWSRLSWSSTLSKAQTAQVTVQIPTISEPIRECLRNPDRLPVELHILRNGKTVFAGPLLSGQKRGDELTLDAGGLMAYLHGMYVLEDKRFDQVDQLAIAAWLIDQWQATEYAHFGINTALVGTSGRVRDQTYDRGEIHQVSRRIEELGARLDGFDAEIDPTTRQLQLWYPGKGSDRSEGQDAVVFDGRNVDSQDGMFSIAPGDLASDSFGSSTSAGADTALWSAYSDPDLRAAFGRWGVAGSWSDISEQATLDDHVTAQQLARAMPLRAPGRNVRVAPDADLDDYDVGDVVQYELDPLLQIGGAFRIRSRTVSMSSGEDDSEESVDLEFV